MLIAVIILSLILLGIALFFSIKKSFQKDPLEVFASGVCNLKLKEKYFSQSEQYFFEFVSSHLSRDYVILPKIGVDNLVEPLNDNLNQFNSVKSKYLDFVVFDSKTFKPIFAIDLVEHGVASSNPYFDRDILSACKLINLPIMTKNVEYYYVWDRLESELQKFLPKKEDDYNSQNEIEIDKNTQQG